MLASNWLDEHTTASHVPFLRPVHAMRLSTSLIIVGGLLAATAVKWPPSDERNRTIGQIYRGAKTGKVRASWYAKIVSPVSLLLIVIGTYLALTWR